VDNYVFIHNAFRNHLNYVISLTDSKKAASEFATWWTILKLHTRVEDELFMPALEGRGFKVPQYIHDGHERVEKAVTAAEADLKAGGVDARKALERVHEELLRHLDEEEDAIMPAMVQYFTVDELWAMDSLIVNPKLGYCDEAMLKTITLWWFGNITSSEGWELFQTFATVKNKGKLKRPNWEELIATMPGLYGKPFEDIVADKLLP